jgi:hypothetical protein
MSFSDAKVLNFELVNADKHFFSFLEVCESIGKIEFPSLIGAIDQRSLNCLKSNVQVSTFCKKRFNKNVRYTRGVVDLKKRRIFCEQADRVYLKYRCDTGSLCEQKEFACEYFQSEFARNLSLIKSSQKDGVFPVKAVMQVNFTIEEVIAVLMDTPRKTEWLKKLIKSEIVETISPDHWIEYAAINLPWPCSDRDLIIELKVNVNSNIDIVNVRFQSVRNDFIKNKDYIRAALYDSKIVLRKAERGSVTMLEIESFVDPKGSIPKWIVNHFQMVQSKKAAKSLIKQLNKKLYSQTHLLKIKNNLSLISKKK